MEHFDLQVYTEHFIMGFGKHSVVVKFRPLIRKSTDQMHISTHIWGACQSMAQYGECKIHSN